MYGDKQKSQINILLQEKTNLTKIFSDLREYFTLMNSKNDGMTKSICMLIYGSDILHDIIGLRKVARDV